ncbi:MAG: class I adenylate-forming enzyme family protein [Pseudomonadota bacterium]
MSQPRHHSAVYPGTINAVIGDHLSHRGRKIAFVEGRRTFTYQQAIDRIDEIAKALISTGIKKGDRIGVLAPPGIAFFEIYVAATSIGAVWFGLNPKYTEKEYGRILNDADPTVLFVHSPFEGRDYAAEMTRLAPKNCEVVAMTSLADGAEAPADFLSAAKTVSDAQLGDSRNVVAPDDPAAIVYTSGSTGQPKGAVLSHRAVCWSACANAEWIGDALQCTLMYAPINHVGGLNVISLMTFVYGGKIVFHDRIDLPVVMALAFEHKASIATLMATILDMLSKIPNASPKVLDVYKLVMLGGGATPETILERFQETAARLVTIYGQTETCGLVTHTPEGASIEVTAGRIGEPIAGVSVRVADASGAPLPPGEVGEIQVSGPVCMSEYFNNPEATNEAFTPDGYFRTGDLGALQEDGLIAFAGRSKEMFKSGGYNVFPLEIEQALIQYKDIFAAVVVAKPDPTFQEVGHAYLDVSDGKQVDIDRLTAFLREQLANYKIPKSFEIVDEFPMLPNGKVDRTALKKRAVAV